MSERTCETCRFFQRSEMSTIGSCRRSPPVPGTEYGFPEVGEDEWCGEHCAYDERPASQSPATRPPETTAKCPKESGPPTSFMGVPVVMTQDEVAPPVWWIKSHTDLDDIPPAPQSRPAETKASGPQTAGTGKPKSGEIEMRALGVGYAEMMEAVGREYVVSRVNYDPMDQDLTVRLSPVPKPSWQALWELGAETRQPVAYCIQCADDDSKVHSLSFDKAALGKIVTRHGGKVVPLYLGRADT